MPLEELDRTLAANGLEVIQAEQSSLPSRRPDGQPSHWLKRWVRVGD